MSSQKHKQSNNQVIESDGFVGKLEETSCPTCGTAPKQHVFDRIQGVSIWKCIQCELMFASPRFTETSLLAIYEAPQFLGGQYSKLPNWNYDDWVSSKDRSYYNTLLKVNLLKTWIEPEARILDVGCSIGLLVAMGRRAGLSIDGVDVSRMLTDLAKLHLELDLYRSDLSAFTPPYLYDGIVLWDVLEHLYDPLSVLRDCNRLLNPGGYIFIQVPNWQGLSQRLKTWLCQIGLREKDFKHFGFPWHIYSFNPSSLKYMLAKANFEMQHCESWNHRLKDGKRAGIVDQFLQKRCLSDNITGIGRKI